MRSSLSLEIFRDTIREIVLRHSGKNVGVFGSVLHGDDAKDCNLHLLVEPTAETTLMDIGAFRYELKNCWAYQWMF